MAHTQMNTLNDIVHRGDKLGATGWSDSTQSDSGYISMEGFAGLSRSSSASRLTKGADSSKVGKLKGKVNDANDFFIRCASEMQLNGKNSKMQLPPKMQGLLSQSPRMLKKGLLNAEDDSPCSDRNKKNPVSAMMLDMPFDTRSNPSKLRRTLSAALLHAEQPEAIDALAAARQMTFRNPFESYCQQHFQTLSAPTMTNIYGAFKKAAEPEAVSFSISQEAEESELWLRTLAFEALFASFGVSSEETVRFGISQEAEDSELWLRTLAFEALLASAKDVEVMRVVAAVAPVAAAPVPFKLRPSVGSWYKPAVF